MALDPSVYDALMFGNVKTLAEAPLWEHNRNVKAIDGILETALSGNITNQQASNANNAMNLQRMDVTEAAAVSSVIRNDLSPQIAAMAGALAALRDVIRTAEPPTS